MQDRCLRLLVGSGFPTRWHLALRVSGGLWAGISVPGFPWVALASVGAVDTTDMV